MITLAQLEEFCCKDPTRPHLLKPFRVDGFTVASDGRILIRVPLSSAASDIAENAVAEAVRKMSWARTNKEFIAIADLPEEDRSECRKCRGSGRAVRCNECRGSGRCECTCGHEHECGECDGTGIANADNPESACAECDGVGTVVETKPIQVGAAFASDVYLRRIASLPSAQIQVAIEPEMPLHFVFDSGEGMLMPMRWNPPAEKQVFRLGSSRA